MHDGLHSTDLHQSRISLNFASLISLAQIYSVELMCILILCVCVCVRACVRHARVCVHACSCSCCVCMHVIKSCRTCVNISRRNSFIDVSRDDADVLQRGADHAARQQPQGPGEHPASLPRVSAQLHGPLLLLHMRPPPEPLHERERDGTARKTRHGDQGCELRCVQKCCRRDVQLLSGRTDAEREYEGFEFVMRRREMFAATLVGLHGEYQ